MIYTHVGQHGNVAPHPHLACAVMVPCTSGILLHSCLQHVTTSLSFSIYILSEHDYSCDSTWKMLAFWKRSFPFGMASWRYLSFKECSSKSFPNEDFNSPTIPNSWSTPTNVFFHRNLLVQLQEHPTPPWSSTVQAVWQSWINYWNMDLKSIAAWICYSQPLDSDS